jgi:glycosyltransferase involved in cell wall biosynthesis
MKDMVILVPSRGRPQNIEDLLFSLQETKTASELLVIVDDDDETLDQYVELGCKVRIIAKQGKGMARPLNFAANLFKDDYRHFAFIGDDHRPRTEYWDQKLIDALDEVGTGIAYGNDLLQGENLPTAVAMSGDIVRALKGMVPPGFIHLYLDNFWMQLGRDLKSFIYLPDVIIEHLHPIAGKAQWDENYRSVNAEEVYSADAKAFDEYIQSEDYQDLLTALS